MSTTTPVEGVTIPTDAEGLQETLSDDKKRQKIFENAGTSKAFLAAYAKVMNKGNVLGAQVSEQVAAAVTDIMKDYGVVGRPDQTSQTSFEVNVNTGPTNWVNSGLGQGAPRWSMTPGMRNAIYNKDLPTTQLDGLYNGLGQMALDVHAHRSNRSVKNPEAWAKVIEITNAYSETDPSTGGFLVPEEMRAMLMSLALEQSIMRSRATVITMSSLTTSIPYVDATTHVGSVFGGMVFYWIGESSTITATEARFGKVKLEANKLVGGARVPNELWADAPALTTWLQAAAPMGLAFYEDVAFINGNGVDQPKGILESEALIQFDRTTTDLLVPADVYGMYARMLPQSLMNGVWLVNQTLLPEIFSLVQPVTNIAGTENVGGGPVNILDITSAPRMSLLGRPLIVTEKVPALANGAGNDIVFIDPTYYLIGDRQGVSLDYSEHSRFMNDETELRIIERVDGRPWVSSPLTPLNGDTVSPFVGITDT
jgi:HK97 family phage major capsid protein